MNIKAIDLFCGAGGSCYGLQEAGIAVKAGLDLDVKCSHAFEANMVGAEALFKTLKRDYIRIVALSDAETALRFIDGWIEDYDKIHPHSALKMASPRQFIRAKSNQPTCPVKRGALHMER